MNSQDTALLKRAVIGLVQDILDSPSLWKLIELAQPSPPTTPSQTIVTPQQATSKELPEFLSNAQAALLLGISPQTLRVWRWRGVGPPYTRLGDTRRARVRFRKAEVENWLFQRRAVNTSEETVREARQRDLGPRRRRESRP